MRAIFSVLGLLVVVAVVGLLARKQLGGAAPAAPAAASSPAGTAAPAGTPQQQLDQVKQAVEGALLQTRPMPDDK